MGLIKKTTAADILEEGKFMQLWDYRKLFWELKNKVKEINDFVNDEENDLFEGEINFDIIIKKTI